MQYLHPFANPLQTMSSQSDRGNTLTVSATNCLTSFNQISSIVIEVHSTIERPRSCNEATGRKQPMHIRKILAAAVGVMTMSAFIPATAAQADTPESMPATANCTPQASSSFHKASTMPTSGIRSRPTRSPTSQKPEPIRCASCFPAGVTAPPRPARGEDHRQPVQAKQVRLHPQRP